MQPVIPGGVPDGDDGTVWAFYLANPDTGNNTVFVDFNNVIINTHGYSVQLVDCDTTDLIDTTGSASNAATGNPTQSVTTNNNNSMLIDIYKHEQNTPGSGPQETGQTQIYDSDNGTWIGGCSYRATTTNGSYAMTWNGGLNDSWCQIVIAVNEAGAQPQTVSLNTLQLQSNTPDVNVSPSAVSQSLDSLSLQATVNAIDVVVPPSLISTNTLELSATSIPIRRVLVFPFFDGFETGDTSEWDGESNSPTINGTAALDGSYGMEVAFNDLATYTYLRWDNTTHQTYRAQFKINTNDLAGNNDDYVIPIALYDGATAVGAIEWEYDVDQHVIRVGMLEDDTTWVTSANNNISTGTEYTVEVEFVFQDSTGFARLWIDDVLVNGVSGADTGTRFPDELRFGNAYGPSLFNSGSYYLDSCYLYDSAKPETVTVDTLLLQSTVNNVNVSPAAASLSLDTLLIEGTANNVDVSPAAVSISLDSLSLQAITNDSVVVAGIATISLDTLLLEGTANSATISPAAISQALNTLGLSASTPDLSITAAAGALSVDLNTLSLSVSAQRLDVQFEVLIFAKRPVGRRYAYQPKIIGGRQVVAAPAAPQSISLDSLLLNSDIGDIAVSPGAVSQSLDTLLLQSFANDSAVVAGAATVSADTLALNGFAIDIAVSPGAASLLLDTLLLNASANNIDISPDVVSFLLDTLLLQSTINDLVVSPGTATTPLDTLLLQALAQSLTVSPAAVTTSLDTLLLQSFTNDINVLLGAVAILLDSLSLQSDAIDLAVSPGAATISADTLQLDASVLDLIVSPAAVSTSLSTLLLQSLVPDISISIGAATVALNTLLLLGDPQAITVSPEAVTISLDELILSANANDINVLLAPWCSSNNSGHAFS
jgi:hypothetical protein